MTNKPSPPVGVACTILSGLMLTGIRTFAEPCAKHADGSIGACHWAAQAVFGVGIVLVILSIVRIFELDEGERRGLSLGIACLGVLVACIPGILIELCNVATMPCRMITQPFCIGIGIAVALIGGIDLAMRLLRLRKPHQRT